MSISTLGELKGAVANWLNRGDMASFIPDFVLLTEADLNRRLRVRDMIVEDTLTINDQQEDLPADTREVKLVVLTGGDKEGLTYKTPSELTTLLATDFVTAGEPKYYTILGDQIAFAPAPSSSYTARILYYEPIPALADDGDSNWLLTKHPDAYLYGALMHSAPFLRDDERVVLWRDAYASAVESMLTESDRAEHSGSKLVAKIKVV